ncbi:hypothetical protein AAVH_08916 [Aphelenchoides avenae]|nr:hypothetical protein AAVH_08916 [Aphelenchus avenae]
MPPSTSLAVVLEVRENGDRLVWDFNKRQDSVLAARVGRVAEWLQIDGENVSVTRALVTTSDVDIRPLTGKHIMLKVPAIKLPDIEGDLGIGVNADRTKRFYSPLVGPIDAFFNTSQFPANVLLELEVIKVPAPLKAAVKAKAGYEPEWMFREQSLSEVTREKEVLIRATINDLYVV